MDNGFFGPRSRENARLLLEAAKELGYPSSVVKTARGGYRAPQDVVDAATGLEGIEEGTVYPAPDEETSESEEQADETLERPNNGASRDEWVAYAKSVGVEVADDDTRNGLIEKVDAQEGSD